MLGLDLVFKDRHGKTLSWLLQSEVWHRRVQFATEGSDDEVSQGGYVYGQHGLSPTWMIGLRGDYFTVLTAENAIGESLDNHKRALVPTVTWSPSEFSKFRLAYEYFEDSFEGSAEKDEGKENHKIQFQSTFIMGAHPAHDF